MTDYYVPRTKKELIRMIKFYYANKKKRVSNLLKMSKTQLYAIFHAIRKITIILILIPSIAGASPIVISKDKKDLINIEKLADAIYLAEGGAKTKHPYGILKKYKTTTPRQACINTIKHALRDWDNSGDFIQFLGSRYCPEGADNDPTGLNKNWVRNVKQIYSRLMKGE